MQTACAMMGKGYTYSSKAADDCRASFDTSFMSSTMPFGSFVQYVYMTPVINNVRFGKWEAVLAAPEINENYIYANLLNHWARGIALARTNKIAAAKKELNLLVQNMNKPDMLVVMQPFNAPVAAAKIAQKLLEATIAEQEKDLPHAINLFSEAVQAEDAFIYNEPKDWLIPARQFLGAALLKSAAYSKAATIFKEDLKENPNNHWSLKGLFESLQKQRLFSAAELIKKQLDKIVFADDMKDMPVVF
jgi:tetratricopeptide (TPR) repeat protein